jgi:uncharacterized protein (DUF1684 family)
MSTVTATRADWAAWHESVENDRRGSYGSLAATALHWLEATPRRLPDLPGEWFVVEGQPVVKLDPGEQLVWPDGTVRSGIVRFDSIPLDHSVFPRWGEVTIEVGERASELIVRPRRPDNPARHTYGGTDTFPYDPRYVVTAGFEPLHGIESVTESVASRIRHRIRVAGIARFAIGDTVVRATIFHHKDGERYRLLFRDRTGGTTTYKASRSLNIDPDSGGSPHELELDFNRTWNLPCAYSPFWTCALPPVENSLPVRIEAGELAPGLRASEL